MNILLLVLSLLWPVTSPLLRDWPGQQQDATHPPGSFVVLHTPTGWVFVPLAPPTTLAAHPIVTVPFHAEEMK